MTLKQKLFKKEIQNPANRYNISQCMLKSGYSKATSRAGTQYKRLRKVTQDIYSEENKQKELREIKRLEKQLKSEKEYTNLLRAKELRMKASQWIKDTVVNEGNNKEVTIIYGNSSSKPIDNPSTINKDSPSIPASINQGNEINNHIDNDTNPVSIDLAIGKIEDREGGGEEK